MDSNLQINDEKVDIWTKVEQNNISNYNTRNNLICLKIS